MEVASLIAPGVISVAVHDEQCRSIEVSLMLYYTDELRLLFRIDGTLALTGDEKVRDEAELEAYGCAYAEEMLHEVASATTKGLPV